MPRSSDSSDGLSADLSSLSANLPNTTPKGPFSSTFQSKFQTPGFSSTFSSNFTIGIGKPDLSSINLPSSGINVPNLAASNPSTGRGAGPENNMESTPSAADAEESDRPRERATKFRFKSKEKAPRSSSPDREPRRHRHRHRSSRPYRDDHRHDDFRDGHERSSRDDNNDNDNDDDDDDREGRRHRRHKHRRRQRREEEAPPPKQQQQPGVGAPGDEPALDPETAFRESLFDAMADDEGAAYWEAIYGQPIHIYPQEAANPRTGELERMTDEEYAAHVRQKMWEKTHAGLLEERARRQRAREESARRDRDREAKLEEERRIRREVERSLRKGEERKRRGEWAARFREYADAWDTWDGDPAAIAWPTRSGRRKDVDGEEVRRFFVRGLDLETLGEKEFATRLKEQRVRWHPDKMQQRLGGREKVDERVMRDATAVFQVIDTLYDDIRSKSK